MIEITIEFLNDHQTEKGGYTRKQLQAIGVIWPPPKGWKKDVIGMTVSEIQATIFRGV